jgi:hypothetical protein
MVVLAARSTASIIDRRISYRLPMSRYDDEIARQRD